MQYFGQTKATAFQDENLQSRVREIVSYIGCIVKHHESYPFSMFGLPQGMLNQGKRIAICLGKARKICKDGQPFFARSLEVAPWATARRLVQMLDCLHGAGWPAHGKNNRQPQRLAQLASLDGLLGPKFYPTPFWLGRLAELLDEFGLPQPLSVTMLEEHDLWPCQWRKFFTALEKAGAVFAQWQLPKPGNGNTKLAFLQSFLQNTCWRI